MFEKLMIALAILGKGMAGIFIVIGILTVMVMLMGKLFGNKIDEKE